MMRKYHSAIALLVVILGFPACHYDVTSFDTPTWTADIIGPLALSSMRLEDIKELNDLEYVTDISVNGLNYDTSGVYVPALPIPLLSFDIHFFDIFHYVDADSIALTITLQNNLGVDIAEGGEIRFTNKVGGELIYSFTLTQPIPKDSTLQVNIVVINKTIEPDIVMTLAGFSTKEESSATLSSDDYIRVSLRLDFIRINEASVKDSVTATISDTTGFNLQGEGLSVVSIEGLFNTYINNSLPFWGEIEAYFLTQGDGALLDSLFVDSLFHEAVVRVPDLLPNGKVAEPYETKLDSVWMDNERINRIIDAKTVYFRLKLTSPHRQPLIADNRFPLEAQIVGDLKVEIEN